MKKEFNITWIDDDPERKAAAENLQSHLKMKVDFIDVKNIKIDDELKKLTEKTEPDLVILDHTLNDVNSETYKRGSTAATFLHEKWPHCPIISLTGVNIEDVNWRNRYAYEGMFDFHDISKYYETIKSIIQGFHSLEGIVIDSSLGLVNLLNAPKDEVEKIIKILPLELKGNFRNESLFLEFFRWFNTVLYNRPGFLYDKLWAATLLGLNQDGFEKVKNQFNEAEYNGIFKDVSKKRWWKGRLIELAAEITGQAGLPWVIGRNLVKLNEVYYSKCYVSGEEFPEIIAATDQTKNAQWHPMKLKHTIPNPKFEDLLFFEELRLMKPADQ